MFTLVIGNKNLSSWSLRPWLVLKHFDIAFTEVKLPLDTPEFSREIGRYSAAKRVPVLLDGEQRIWDSLAIAEYLNEKVHGRAWPADAALRAHARAVSSEMHSGFVALRQHWPMKSTGNSTIELPPAGRDDVARIEQLWSECRSQYASRGPWLFGGYSIADAMYAPVALRFRHYGTKLSNNAADSYFRQTLQDPHLQSWIKDSEAEVAGGYGVIGR